MRTFCLLMSAGLGLALSSCETVDKHHAGGGAFDDSQLGQRLDANKADLEVNRNEKDKPAVPEYSQWEPLD